MRGRGTPNRRRPLRVLIANETRDRADQLADVVAELEHHVVASHVAVTDVAAATNHAEADVALVSSGHDAAQSLELISEIVREAACPVIALLRSDDPAFVQEAAERGVFAFIVDANPADLQGAIDVTLNRFAELQSLQGAFTRRAVIEQAKGILMARHNTNADRAFAMLRGDSQSTGHRIVDIAHAVIDAHLLLPGPDQGR
jgi:AmiR/NasT family two-component response regulator